ncbi:uncharacterized mitochondrial protein-like protein [Tanacetum coccineum]|uniref:Uncharacterized mitochondrial protein-like protein n=1 Tax=Tanacetum coccineum TaxID=301880 RepID=A0ABQ5C5T6_9ASTR
MLTAPYAPQQNGIVERRNHTLLEMIRGIMKARGVPNYFWGEAVRHVTYIINRTPTRALVGVTPYEKFYGEKPNLEDLKPLNENTTNGPAVEEQPTHDSPRHTSTVHVTKSSTVHDTVPSIVHAIVPRQNTYQVTVHSPQTPTNEDDSEDDDAAIPVRHSTRNTSDTGTREEVQALRAWNTKLDNSLKEMGFQQYDLFMTGTSLGCINKFKKKMASQFEMSDLGELTYYLGIKVSQGKDCVEIKQERYERKILKESGMENCNANLYPMERDLKLSKVEDEPEVEAT